MESCSVFTQRVCSHSELLWFSFSLRFVELRHVCLSLAGKLTDSTKRIDAALLKGIIPRRRIETLSHPPLLPLVCFCDLWWNCSSELRGESPIFNAELSSSSGDLAAAKALLAQMKYYANIEEKVKEKLSEFMWTSCHLSKCVSLCVILSRHFYLFFFNSRAEIMYTLVGGLCKFPIE